MPIEIQTRVDAKRGCGWRKPGGIYLIGPPEGHACCKLPHPLDVCSCCGQGIKPSRGWTWVNADKIFGSDPCSIPPMPGITHSICPLHAPERLEMTGLIWIGEKFYKTPEDFQSEANLLGVSRRINTVPKGFVLGETWIMLAHRKVCVVEKDGEQDLGPGIFTVFKPTALEYVVTGEETEEELERMVKRGITPVKVEPKIKRVPK